MLPLLTVLAMTAVTPTYCDAEKWNAQEYRQYSDHQMGQSDRMIDRLNLRGDEAILDVGCGDGRLTAKIAQAVPLGCVIGIDPSGSMLELASELVGTTPNLTFFRADAETFAFDRKFDCIVASFALHWVQDQEKALQNIASHLKPGGTVYFILAQSKEGSALQSALDQTKSAFEGEFSEFVSDFYHFDSETYRKLMTGAGLHIDEIRYVYVERTYADSRAWVNFVRQWLPEGKWLDPDQRELFFELFRVNYLAQIGHPDGDLPLVYGEYLLTVEGRKAS